MDQTQVAAGRGHLELMLLNGRAVHLDRNECLSVLKGRGMPAEVLAQFDTLWDETRVCGFKLIYIGRVLIEKFIEFLEANSEIKGREAFGAVVFAMVESSPFLDQYLAPFEQQLSTLGLGSSYYESGIGGRLKAHAQEFLRTFSTIMNANKDFFPVLEDLGGEGAAADGTELTPTGSYISASESDNPFDLDDALFLSEGSKTVVKYLIKMSTADRSFDESEKKLLVHAVRDLGEELTNDQFKELAGEASKQSLADLLAGIKDQTTGFKERLLFLGMLSAAADGSVDPSEKKLLAESIDQLGITKQRYAQISQEALKVIKARKT